MLPTIKIYWKLSIDKKLIGLSVWKHALFIQWILKKFVNRMKIWHFHQGVVLGTIWIEHIDQVFNQEQCHNSKVKNLVWSDLILYTKVAWERGWLSLLQILCFLAEALFEGFDETWSVRNILCRCDNLRSTWNWKCQCMQVVWHCGWLLGGGA